MKRYSTALFIATTLAVLTSATVASPVAELRCGQIHSRNKDLLAAASFQVPARLPSKALNDSSRRISRIVGIQLDPASDELTVRLELSENQSWLEIALFNMLGKRVKDIFRGQTTADIPIRDFSASISDLPNGLYIVSVQGSNVRLADKVFISR